VQIFYAITCVTYFIVFVLCTIAVEKCLFVVFCCFLNQLSCVVSFLLQLLTAGARFVHLAPDDICCMFVDVVVVALLLIYH